MLHLSFTVIRYPKHDSIKKRYTLAMEKTIEEEEKRNKINAEANAGRSIKRCITLKKLVLQIDFSMEYSKTSKHLATRLNGLMNEKITAEPATIEKHNVMQY